MHSKQTSHLRPRLLFAFLLLLLRPCFLLVLFVSSSDSLSEPESLKKKK